MGSSNDDLLASYAGAIFQNELSALAATLDELERARSVRNGQTLELRIVEDEALVGLIAKVRRETQRHVFYCANIVDGVGG